MTPSAGRANSSVELPDDVLSPAPGGNESCAFCGSATEVSLAGVVDNRLGTPGTYEIRRCLCCGLEQTAPRPSLVQLKALYEGHYNFGEKEKSLYSKLRERFLFSFLYRLWVRVDGDVAFHQRRGTGLLLDIGCNEGRGLRMYARNGFRVEGLELNETAASTARSAGFNVYTCPLENFAPAASYDVAVLSNVLEHSLDTRKMLRVVHEILTPGGQVWISCPNSQSWQRSVFGRSWLNWHVPFHIVHFSSMTLRQSLEDAGFTHIELRQVSPALWMAQSLIVYCFSGSGRKTRQLRNPFLTLFFMLFARCVLFPALWFGNRIGRGDCLIAVATKA